MHLPSFRNRGFEGACEFKKVRRCVLVSTANKKHLDKELKHKMKIQELNANIDAYQTQTFESKTKQFEELE